MKKGLFVVFLCVMNASVFAFACGRAVPTNDVNFCSSFKSVAICYCTASGLPAGMCQDMNALYNRFTFPWGSLERACASQKYTSTQDCIDNWNCYRLGRNDSQGRLCSGTGAPCA